MDVINERLTPIGVTKVVHSLGFGLYQLWQLLVLGGVFFIQAQTFYLFAQSTRTDNFWGLPAATRAALISVTVGGRSLGFFAASFFQSRRLPVLFGLLIATASLAGLAVASGQALNFILRCAASFGGALGTAPALTLIREILPGKSAWLAFTLMCLFWVLGAFSGRFALWFEEDLAMAKSPGHCDLGWLSIAENSGCSWKTLAELCTVPAVLFFIAACFQLNESPLFFAINGKHVETNLLLRRVAQANGKRFTGLRFVPSAVSPPAPGGFSAAMATLSRKEGATTLTISVTLTTLVYWFFLIRLGQENDSQVPAAAAAAAVLAGAFTSLPSLFKLRGFSTLALCAVAWIYFARGGPGVAAAELLLLGSLTVLKVAGEMEVCDFFPEDERIAGVSMVFGAASSVVSFFELAAHLVPIDASEIYLPTAGILLAVLLAALLLAPRTQPLLAAAEEKQKLLN